MTTKVSGLRTAATIFAGSCTAKPESKKTWLKKTRSKSPCAAASANRASKVSNGSVAIRVTITRPSSSSRAICRAKLMNSDDVVSTRTGLSAGKHESSRTTNACVFGPNVMVFGSGRCSARAICALRRRDHTLRTHDPICGREAAPHRATPPPGLQSSRRARDDGYAPRSDAAPAIRMCARNLPCAYCGDTGPFLMSQSFRCSAFQRIIM